MRKAKIFFINGMILTITALIMRCINLVFNIYIANKVGSEAVGIFSLIMSIYLFAITIATSGLGIACTCIVSEELAKKNYQDALSSVKTCLFFAVLLGFFSSILIIIFAPVASNIWLNDVVSPTPFYIISLGLPLISISAVIGGFFSSIEKPYLSAISQFAETSAKIIATIILLNMIDITSVEEICVVLIVADVISEVFSFTLNNIFYKIEQKKFKIKNKLPIKMKKRILKTSLPIGITSCIRSGLSSLKQFLIPLRLELSGLSYSVAVSNYGLIDGMVFPVLLFSNVFITSFSGLLIPEFSRLLAGENFKRLEKVSSNIFNIIFSFSICVTSIFLIFSDELSTLIYSFTETSYWMKLLAPLILFMYIDNIIDNMLKGINEQVNVMICNIVDLLVTILIIFFVVPELGMSGYILSIYISEILNFTISIIQLNRKIKIKIDFKEFLLKPIIASLFSYLLIYNIDFYFLPTNINVILQIAIFLLAFSLIKWKFSKRNAI